MPAGEAGRKTQNFVHMKKRSPCDLGNKFTSFFAPCQGVGQKKGGPGKSAGARG